MDDCLKRLGACGAVADLVALTKHCLELEPKDRPQDASVLAERVSGYLQSVETKLRKTEMAKVDAQVRAEELHRRHKLAFTASAAIVASLVIGIATSAWQAVRANHEAKRAELEATRAKSGQQRAVAALDELRATGPAFAEQEWALAAKELFKGAIAKLNYAVMLQPGVVEFLVAKGDLLQCQLRDHPRLRQLGAEIMSRMGYAATSSKDIFWKGWDREQTFCSALRAKGIIFGFKKHSAWTDTLDIHDHPLRDLSILKSMPIIELDLHRCLFVDLTALRDLKLKKLSINSDSVTDLSPLRRKSIDRLYRNNCLRLTDISPLTALPLGELSLDGCQNLNDVAALAEIPTLEKVTVPVHARNIEALRKRPKLKLLGFGMMSGVPGSSAEDFWRAYGWVSRLHEWGIKPQAVRRHCDSA